MLVQLLAFALQTAAGKTRICYAACPFFERKTTRILKDLIFLFKVPIPTVFATIESMRVSEIICTSVSGLINTMPHKGLAKPVIICTPQYVQKEQIKHCFQEAKSQLCSVIPQNLFVS